MKIRPLHDRVIVKRLDEEKKTASGIVIPDTAAEKPDQGEVMAVGKGKLSDEGKLMPLDIKIGDRVLFGKYSGQTVRLKGDELLVMRGAPNDLSRTTLRPFGPSVTLTALARMSTPRSIRSRASELNLTSLAAMFLDPFPKRLCAWRGRRRR